MRARDRSMRCDSCGTMNKDTSRFCLYCGAPLTTIGAETAAPATAPPAPPPSVPRANPIRPLYMPRPRTPDYVGLFGVAFFLLVLGIVFYLNGNLLTELRRWWDQVLAGRGAFRPPEGVIVSAGLFWGLLGVSNFVAAGHERVVRRRARGRGDRGPVVHLHRRGPVLDDPAVPAGLRRRVSYAAAMTGIRAGRGRTTRVLRAG